MSLSVHTWYIIDVWMQQKKCGASPVGITNARTSHWSYTDCRLRITPIYGLSAWLLWNLHRQKQPWWLQVFCSARFLIRNFCLDCGFPCAYFGVIRANRSCGAQDIHNRTKHHGTLHVLKFATLALHVDLCLCLSRPPELFVLVSVPWTDFQRAIFTTHGQQCRNILPLPCGLVEQSSDYNGCNTRNVIPMVRLH